MGRSWGSYRCHFNYGFRLNLTIVVFALLTYQLNNHVLKGTFSSTFISNYFNDMLGGLLIVAFTNMMASTQMEWRLYLKSVRAIIVFSGLAGVYWEYVAPLYVEESISDPYDVLAYIAGGLAYWLMIGCVTYLKLIHNQNIGCEGRDNIESLGVKR